jgi:hypothetical protein
MKRCLMKLGLQKAFLIALAMGFTSNVLPMTPVSSATGAPQGTVPQVAQPVTTVVSTPAVVAPVQAAPQPIVVSNVQAPAAVVPPSTSVQAPATVTTPVQQQTVAVTTPVASAVTPAPLQPTVQPAVAPIVAIPPVATPAPAATTAPVATTPAPSQPAAQPSTIPAVVQAPATPAQASTTAPVASVTPSQPLAQIGVVPSQVQPAATTQAAPASTTPLANQPVAATQPPTQSAATNQDQQVQAAATPVQADQKIQDPQVEEQALQKMARNIRYGDRIILKHAKTGMRLASRLGYNFNHKGSSGQQMVFCNGDRMNMSHYWLVKGPHGTARDYKFGQMVQPGDAVRLEHYSSKRNLHSDAVAKAPSGKNQEVYCFTKNQGDENCNWLVQGNLSIDTPVSFKHQKTAVTLRCDATPLVQDKKSIEVSAAATADDGSNWVVERSVATPTVYSGALEVVFGRGGNLSSADARYIKDTTNLLKAQIKGNRLKLPLAGQKSSLDSIGLARESSDDKRGLMFVYKLSGELFVSLSNEFDPIAVPNNDKAIALIKSGQGLGTGFRLLRALYGDLNKITGDKPAQVYDVTKRVQGLLSGGKIEFAEGSKSVTFGFDPAKGKTKALLIFYKFGRKIYARLIADLDKATIDSAAPEKDAQLVVDLDAAPVSTLPSAPAAVAPAATPAGTATGVAKAPAKQPAPGLVGKLKKGRAAAKRKIVKAAQAVKGAVQTAIQTVKQQLPGATPAPVAQASAPVTQPTQQLQQATQTVTTPVVTTPVVTTPVATTPVATTPVPAASASPVAVPQGGAPKVDPLPTLAA